MKLGLDALIKMIDKYTKQRYEKKYSIYGIKLGYRSRFSLQLGILNKDQNC
jgi:hypothetical protein